MIAEQIPVLSADLLELEDERQDERDATDTTEAGREGHLRTPERSQRSGRRTAQRYGSQTADALQESARQTAEQVSGPGDGLLSGTGTESVTGNAPPTREVTRDVTRIPVDSAEARELREAEEERRAAAAADQAEAHDPACRRGWLGEDSEGRPRPCPHCRPWLWDHKCLTCSSPQSHCHGQRERLGVRCCVDCEHRPVSLRSTRGDAGA